MNTISFGWLALQLQASGPLTVLNSSRCVHLWEGWAGVGGIVTGGRWGVEGAGARQWRWSKQQQFACSRFKQTEVEMAKQHTR